MFIMKRGKKCDLLVFLFSSLLPYLHIHFIEIRSFNHNKWFWRRSDKRSTAEGVNETTHFSCALALLNGYNLLSYSSSIRHCCNTYAKKINNLWSDEYRWNSFRVLKVLYVTIHSTALPLSLILLLFVYRAMSVSNETEDCTLHFTRALGYKVDAKSKKCLKMPCC